MLERQACATLHSHGARGYQPQPTAAAPSHTTRQQQLLAEPWCPSTASLAPPRQAPALVRCDGDWEAPDGQRILLLSQSAENDFQITQEHNKALKRRPICVYEVENKATSSISEILRVKWRFIHPFIVSFNNLVSEEL